MISYRSLRIHATLLVLAAAALPGLAGVLPLQDNRWDNPAFVAAFTGTYGFDTERNPGISAEEKKLFETITPLIGSRPDEAVTLLTAAITPASSGALDYTLANIHFQAGRAPEAIAAYRAALKKFPNFVRAHRNLGMLFVQQGQFAEALPELQQAAATGGLDGSILGLIGYCYLNLGRTASALDAYRLALIFEPASRDWRLGKAQCLLLIGENKEGIAMLDEMLAEQSGEATLLLLQANAFLADGQAEKAAANIQVVRALGKASAESLVLLGDIFINQGNTAVAVDAYLAALDAGKLGTERELHLVRALAARSAWAEADVVLQRIRKGASDASAAASLELMNLEAQVALGRDDDARAAEILEGVVAKDPLNGRALLLLADYHAKQDDIERAELYYERAARVTDTAPDALIQHARLLVSRRDFAKAAQLLTRAQSLRPQAHVAAYLSKVETAAQSVR